MMISGAMLDALRLAASMPQGLRRGCDGKWRSPTDTSKCFSDRTIVALIERGCIDIEGRLITRLGRAVLTEYDGNVTPYQRSVRTELDAIMRKQIAQTRRIASRLLANYSTRRRVDEV